MNHRISTGYFTKAIAVSLATALAAGCGGKSEEEVASQATQTAAPESEAKSAAQPGALPGDERLANAVATSKTAAPVDLKYDIAAKPDVGQPFEVDLTFLPRLAADALEVEISSVEGLTLVSSGGVRFDNVQAGERYTTKVLAQSAAAGMYYIGIAAKMTTEAQTEVRTFSVPIVVGTPAAAEKPAPQKDASGEAIEPMPAVESGAAEEAEKP
jgi:hypothetical protein